MRTFFYGVPGDVPLLGGWDGDGLDTPGMYRPSDGFAYPTNETPPDRGVGVGDPALTLFFGIPGDAVVSGDWDGSDTVGVFRPSTGTVLLRNTNTTGEADVTISFGNPNWLPVAGHF